MTDTNTATATDSQGVAAPDRHFVAAIPCAIPLGTVFLIFVVVFLHRTLGLRGAVIHDFSTVIGSLFSIAAYAYMTALLWGPAGLFLSVLLSGTNTSGRHRLLYPLGYLACCILAAGLLIVDPFGTFAYFID